MTFVGVAPAQLADYREEVLQPQSELETRRMRFLGQRLRACLRAAGLSRRQFAERTGLALGHNPGVEALLAELAGEDEHLSTGSIARIELDIARWADLKADTEGRLETIWRPRDLD